MWIFLNIVVFRVTAGKWEKIRFQLSEILESMQWRWSSHWRKKGHISSNNALRYERDKIMMKSWLELKSVWMGHFCQFNQISMTMSTWLLLAEHLWKELVCRCHYQFTELCIQTRFVVWHPFLPLLRSNHSTTMRIWCENRISDAAKIEN